jgi:hypothetical protein
MVYGSAATSGENVRPRVTDQEACNLFPRHRI